MSTQTVRNTVMHAGFIGEKQVTSWDRRRDAIYSKTRQMMLQQGGGNFTIKSQTFIEKR